MLFDFTQVAMATRWTLRIDVERSREAEAVQSAEEAFGELKRLEQLLSHFIASSDVARVNALAAGTRVWVQAETFECLQLAFQIAEETENAFDVCAGTLIDFYKKNAKLCCDEMPDWRAAYENYRFGKFILHPAEQEVECARAGKKIDLGGIGKGFALDKMAAILKEWEFPRALLIAGGSTILALDAPAGKTHWRIGTESGEELLVNEALSSSGTQFQPTQFVDPRTGLLAVPAKTVRSRAASAARADAFSTARAVGWNVAN